MINPFQQPGAFSWCELMTTDLKGAEAFYAQLFGWTMADGPVDGIEYRVISAGGQGIGGLMSIPPDMQQMPPNWGTYVTVEDVDATAQLAQDLGGRVLMPPQDIPTVGRFTLIQDPQGAVISAISYLPPPTAA
ncbi:MAG: VOC family protein [Thermosynechococcaceae cyanobacterium]